MRDTEQHWACIEQYLSREACGNDLRLAMRLLTLPLVSDDEEQDKRRIQQSWFLFEEYEQWLIEIKPSIRGEDWFTFEQKRGLFDQAWGQQAGIQSVVFGSPQDDGAAADKLLATFESCLTDLIRGKDTIDDETPSHAEVLAFIKDWRQEVMAAIVGLHTP